VIHGRRVVRPPRLGFLLRRRAPEVVEEEERHATWLELFFDLLFVLALTGIISRLGNQTAPPAGAILDAAGIFVLVQWAWVGQAFYDNRFNLDDVPHRLLVLAATAGVGAIAAGTRDVPNSLLLPIGYLVVRGALILQYLRVYFSDLPNRGVTPVYLTGFGTGWLLWLGSLALLPPSRPVVWVAALVVELLTPWIAHRQLARYPVHETHLPERIGQFTIILLGGTLTELNNAVPAFHAPGRAAYAAALAFVVPASIWWAYTTFLISRPTAEKLRSGQKYSYLHVPNGLAILFLGWALGQLVHEVALASAHVPLVLRAALGASLAVWILCGLGIQWFSANPLSSWQECVAAGWVVPIVVVSLVVTDPIALLVLLSLLVAGHCVLISRQISQRAAAVESAPAAPPLGTD
jgi:low temperature requirement protein LtrA